MKKVIVVGTACEVVFGVLDEDGDVVATNPLKLQIPKLTEDNLRELIKVVAENKAKMEKELEIANP
jgi:hypothetical protein